MALILEQSRSHAVAPGNKPFGEDVFNAPLDPNRVYEIAGVSEVDGSLGRKVEISSQPEKGAPGNAVVRVRWFAGMNPFNAQVSYTIRVWDDPTWPTVIINDVDGVNEVAERIDGSGTFLVKFRPLDSAIIQSHPVYQILDTTKVVSDWVPCLLGLSGTALSGPAVVVLTTILIYTTFFEAKVKIHVAKKGGWNQVNGAIEPPVLILKVSPA